MNKSTMVNNVVKKETLQKIQESVLENLSETLKHSFGPMGSNTCIKKENAMNIYTKDGHTILKNIHFHGIIEQSIKDDVETITRHIVKTVGDGTTSAVMLAYEIFKAISNIDEDIAFEDEDDISSAVKSIKQGIANIGKNNEDPRKEIPPYETNMNNTNTTPKMILDSLNKIISKITDKIKSKAKECTVEDIYDIAMISTNGNEFISQTIADIYKEHGMEVFIDVIASIDNTTMVKAYDGMTLNTGFANPCYVTDSSKNEAVVDKPRVYFFEHPIDTKEMTVLLDAILSKNIVTPYNEATRTKDFSSIIPTVIVAPKISQDLSSVLNSILNLMSQLPPAQKLPLLIITDYHQVDEVKDIALMCNAPSLHKYIDNEILEEDIKNGNAPTPDTIQDFCGYCDQVVASVGKTSFINPIDMKDDNGNYSIAYNNLISYLEVALKNAKESGEEARVIGGLKRRIHALKSNLVELYIGGIDQSDRDALRDLVEDAVLNCRSASANGVGYGANYMGLEAASEITDEYIDKDLSGTELREYIINTSIEIAYMNIIEQLYSDVFDKPEYAAHYLTEQGCPMNIRTREFDHKVKSSIESDIIVLETVGKIIGMMATCNQFIVPTAMHNVYEDYLTE